MQKLSARNREHLLQNGYFFPRAGRDEQRLLKGTISPGNARELSILMAQEDWDAVTRWIDVRVADATRAGCARLLLSSELLLAALSKSGCVDQLESAASKAGVGSVQMLLIVRDPVDQAVSLYKHRAKKGNAAEVGDWIRVGYSLPGDLAAFLEQADRSSTEVHIRKYSRKSEDIVKLFFEDWLGIGSPTVPVDSSVNSSLTLSELAIIAQLAKAHPEDVPLFYATLLAIPAEQKAKDAGLENEVRQIVEHFICQFDRLWSDIDVRLRRDGGISIPARVSTPTPVGSAFRFSESQLRAWVQAQAASRSAHYRLQLWMRLRLRPPLGRIKRQLRKMFVGNRV